jgi:ribosomal protein S12 methylthiotransferase
MPAKPSIQFISLGCAKNLVDSERLAHQLSLGGWQVAFGDNPAKADVAIVNTCAFIADAKEESVDTILELAEAKKQGSIGKIIVFGCLSQRYRNELAQEIPEVDFFFGTDQLQNILHALNTPFCLDLNHQRSISTPNHYAYLKVSEGCNRKCAFCIIPKIRGKHKSVSINYLLDEANYLANQGTKELILVAQDLSSYGTDLKQPNALADLLRELEKIKQIEWIRLHYAYPAGFPINILPLMADSKKILSYLDIPFQHASDKMLQAMRRGHTAKETKDLIRLIRKQIPGIAIRTTLITGFPGETEQDFEELKQFVQEFAFERLGVFTFSPEEGTHAASLHDHTPQNLKEERAEMIMALQHDIATQHNLKLLDTNQEVIIDAVEENTATGRTKYDSPEVDQEVIITNAENLRPGSIVMVNITEAEPFELYGKYVPKNQ